MIITLDIDPVAKPRMTQRDKWKKRPSVIRYRAFCDEVRRQWGKDPFPEHGASVIFNVPMPKSWSKKKKKRLCFQPHQQKPDVDNLLKALLDALCEDDSYIWNVRITKMWANEGSIIIETHSL